MADLGPSSRYIQFSDLTVNFCVMKHLIFLFEGELDRFFSNIRKPLSDSLHGKNRFVYEYPSIRDIPSFLQPGGVILASSAIIYNIVKVKVTC